MLCAGRAGLDTMQSEYSRLALNKRPTQNLSPLTLPQSFLKSPYCLPKAAAFTHHLESKTKEGVSIMGAKRNNMIALIAAGLFVGLAVFPASAQTPETLQSQDTKAAKFTRDLALALDHRLERIVSLDTFTQMYSEANTVILDTRTAADFAAGHIYGAVNVPLSEMSLLRLADAIDDRQTRILIYGDENIGEVSGRSDYDISTLPVNLLTYIGLHNYGYYEVYELGEKASFRDERLNWIDTPQLVASLETASFN